jgi:hypothetical protein
MADFVPITPGVGADIAVDTVNAEKVQRVKLMLGADGVDDGDVSATNPMPVEGDVTISGSVSVTGSSVTVSNFPATQPISAAALPLPTGAATETTLAAINTRYQDEAMDLVGGDLYPYTKVAFGADGAIEKVDGSNPLPVADANVEAQLVSIDDKLPVLGTGLADEDDSYVPVASIPAHQLRIGFDRVIANNVDIRQMTLLQTGSGQTVNQSGGSLVLTAGTTANTETIIRSVESVSGSVALRWSTTLTQRIANNNFYVELVDVIGDGLSYTLNSTTSMTVTIPSNPFTSQNVGQGMWVSPTTAITAGAQRVVIASVSGNNVTFTGSGWPAAGSGTCFVYGWNYHQNLYTSTVATTMNFDAQRNGWASGTTAATINTTASGHVPTYTASDAEVAVMDQTGASSTGLEVAQRGSRVRNVPDSNTPLYIQIRVLNGTTNPASGTTWTVGFVDVQYAATQPVSITNVSPMSSNTGLPVTVLNPTTTTTLNASSNLIGDVSVQYRNNSSGAGSRSHIVAANTTNATVVKASAGRVVGWQLLNTTAAAVYLKFHNQTTTPTAGASVFMSVGIPANGKSEISYEGGFAFSTGIGFTTVTGAADTDTTAVAANAIVGDILFA